MRRGGQRLAQWRRSIPLIKSIETSRRGGRVGLQPCVQSRGYQQSDLLEGVTITGASVVHAQIKEGAATLSF